MYWFSSLLKCRSLLSRLAFELLNQAIFGCSKDLIEPSHPHSELGHLSWRVKSLTSISGISRSIRFVLSCQSCRKNCHSSGLVCSGNYLQMSWQFGKSDSWTLWRFKLQSSIQINFRSCSEVTCSFRDG